MEEEPTRAREKALPIRRPVIAVDEKRGQEKTLRNVEDTGHGSPPAAISHCPTETVSHSILQTMMKHLPECFLVLSIFPSLLLTGGEDVPVILNGLINQSIPMSLSGGPSDPVRLVSWNFKTTLLVTYTNNQIIGIDEKFRGRLEILNDGKVLRIGHLRLEDSGLYTATIIFTNNANYQKVYNLTVYEPVPTPSIVAEERKDSPDWCNVTLRCSVPTNKSSLSYTWKYRHGGSDYQLYKNSGDTIQMSLQAESREMEVLCIIHNQADMKNISLRNLCLDHSVNVKSAGDLTCWIQLYIYIPILIILSLSLPFLCLLNRRKPE
ncbi:SLAM family member 9-like [Rana temporaria]|uniref:SLAM family member 9-like n=1 Tax=Rana temporaria TaxID=8407 RepID=UPI001AAD6DBC|nr:SLAM family member 9-like [Rana temporaria]